MRSNNSANKQKSGFLCSIGLKFYFPVRNILFSRQEYFSTNELGEYETNMEAAFTKLLRFINVTQHIWFRI